MKGLNTKVVAYILCVLMLVGCSKPPVPQVQDEKETQVTPTQQGLSNEATSEYYRTIIPYVASPTRGLIYSYLPSRYDIDEFELSLMRQSQSYFDPSKVYFQEGQHLDKPTVRRMLAKKKTGSELNEELATDSEYVDLGLNPDKETMIEVNGITLNPVYLAYLLEQDYVVLEDNQQTLQGITIGLALNPFQTFKNELGYDQVVKMDENEVIAKGKEIAQEVVEMIRSFEGLENVEIMVGLYVLEEESSVVPGRMVAKTLVSSQSSKIKNWQEINERYYLLPDNSMKEVDYDLSNQFSTFKDKIKEYYPHYYGVVGVSHFADNKLENLEITINIDFYGLAEKLSFHQLVAQLMNETFSNHYDLTVVVRSTEEIFGILQRDANQKDVNVKLISWE